MSQPDTESTPSTVEVKYSAFKINVHAANKLNVGDYSSVERGLFLSRDVLIPEGTPEEEVFKILQTETRKIQFMADAQVAAIVLHVMNDMEKDVDSGFIRTWKKLATASWNGFANKSRKLFGLPTIEEEKAAATAPKAT